MSSFAATIMSGGESSPARIASVTDAPSSRAKFAVCSATNSYLSFMPSRMLCTPWLRSIAGLAPGWPCRFTIFAPSGKPLDDQVAPAPRRP